MAAILEFMKKFPAADIRRKARHAFANITVEPIMFLFFFGKDMAAVILTTSLYYKICAQNFSDRDDVNCEALKKTPDVERFVQQKASYWNMYISLSYLIPLIVMGPIMGAFGDRYGRKINILVGMAGFSLSAILYLSEFIFAEEMPLFWLPIGITFIAFTGYIGSTMSSVYAYLSDRIPNKSRLTVRFTILQVVANVANVIASYSTGFLLQYMAPMKAMIFPQVIWTAAFFYALIVLKQTPPSETYAACTKKRAEKLAARKIALENPYCEPNNKAMNGITGHFPEHPVYPENPEQTELTAGSLSKRSTTEDQNQPQTEFNFCYQKPPVKLGFIQTIKSVFVEAWELLKSSVKTALKHREGHFRSYIWVAFGSFTIINTTHIGLRTVLKLFMLRSPIAWSPADIAFYHGFDHLILLIGNGVSIFLLRGWHGMKLRCHETMIIIISTVSMMARLAMVGFSTNTTTMYIAAVFGFASNLLYPVYKSMVCQFVQPDEVGKVYALFQYATDFGILTSTIGFNPLYAATYDLHPGFVFFFIVVLLFVAMIPVCWLHIDYKRYRKHRAAEPKNADAALTDNSCSVTFSDLENSSPQKALNGVC